MILRRPRTHWAIDIETFGHWERIPERIRDRILRRAKHSPDTRDPSTTCALHWPRGEIITIGATDLVTRRTTVFQRMPDPMEPACGECKGPISFHRDGCDLFTPDREIHACFGENALLFAFWKLMFLGQRAMLPDGRTIEAPDPDAETQVIVTWNGTNFDLPFLLNRSRIGQQKRVPRDAIDWTHIDLAQELIGDCPPNQALIYSFDEVCCAFNVPSSKAGGVDGGSVADLWRAKKARQIADYCGDDTRALADLLDAATDMEIVLED